MTPLHLHTWLERLHIPFWMRRQAPLHHTGPPAVSRKLDPKKQAELERLCAALFKRTELITSGKLRLLSLASIKKRLGRKWKHLSELVYETVENALQQHTGPNDLYIHYRDDTYVIVFATASPEESERTSIAIASAIRKRLFELDEAQLRQIEMETAIGLLRTDKAAEYGFEDFLDKYASEPDHLPDLMCFESTGADDNNSSVSPQSVDISAADYRCSNHLQPETLPLDISLSFEPSWDVKRNALTTYICEPVNAETNQSLLNLYDSTIKQDLAHQLSLDLKILEHAIDELARMEKEGRKALVTCPVQYYTLHVFESYELYKERLVNIPVQHRPLLIFHIVNPTNNLPIRDAYWFAMPLRRFCRHIFAEFPLRQDINFSYLKNIGIDYVGVRLEDMAYKHESKLFVQLSQFGTRAKMLHIPSTFVLGVNTISLATSAVCAGFDMIGGAAIHPKVYKPDGISKFSHVNLIQSFMPAEHTGQSAAS